MALGPSPGHPDPRFVEVMAFHLLRSMFNKALHIHSAAIRMPALAFITFVVLAVWPHQTYSQEGTDTTGTVHLLRRTGYVGAMDGYSVFMDGWRICLLNNKKYSVHQVPKGEHRFSVRIDGNNEKENAEGLVVEVEAGRVHYISIDQRNSFTTKLTLQELAGSTGKKAMEDLTRDDNCE